MKHKVTAMAPRSSLLAQLDALSHKQIFYLHAPAGFGKTFSAGIWLDYLDARRIVLSLTPRENHLPDFCRLLCSTMAAYQPDNVLLRELAGHPGFDSAPDEYTIRALTLFAGSALDTETYVVFDDLHLITDPAVLRLLPLLLKRMPKSTKCLFLSRHEPPESFSDLVIKEEIAFITEKDLRFTREEIREYYGLCGYDLSGPQLENIYAATDGWAIGVTALLLSGPEESSFHELIRKRLDNFVETQIWNKWSEARRAFLLKTACIEELTPALCTALTGEADSAAFLEQLLRENAFLTYHDDGKDGTYRFHWLFRNFLRGLFEREDVAFQRAQYKAAGDWYYQQGQIYKAAEAYFLSQDEDRIAHCLIHFTSASLNDFIIDKVLSLIRTSVDPLVVEKYPYLLTLQAWAAYSEGRPQEMFTYLDRYYERFPEIVRQDPSQIAGLVYVRCFDFRTPMTQLVKEIGVTSRQHFLTLAGTITQNMPFFHRSVRDFSEYISEGNMAEDKIAALKIALGGVLGDECDMMEATLKAGLLYAQGKLAQAHSLAISANAQMREDFSMESKFCAMVMLAEVLAALRQYEEAHRILRQTEEMIEENNAYYLSYNLNAYATKVKLDNGDVKAALQWLENHGTPMEETLPFNRLYGHFATARAYIALGKYKQAISLLEKVLALCQAYQRPLDSIEAQVLLAIACWKKKRGDQKEGLHYLEQAVILASQYGYTQIFISEGAELSTMLYRLQNRAIRQNYTGEVPGSFAKMLHLQALSHAQHAGGLTSGQTAEPLKFTEKQKTVMRLLCEGNSYRKIAESMGLKFSTVRSHIELIYKKLDVPNEMEAIMKIQDLQLLEEEKQR